MWRRVGSTAAWALAGVFALAGSAGAGVTYDFQFRSHDLIGNSIPGGSVSPDGHAFTFSSPAAAHGCDGGSPFESCPVLDVLLLTTDPLVAFSVSVRWDDLLGLAAGYAVEAPWAFDWLEPPLVCDSASCSSFDFAVGPPFAPPSLPAGTYHLGTIVWNTSALGAGSTAIAMALLPAQDGTAAVIGGMVTEVTGSEGLAVGLVNVVPEPATALLLGLGVALLARARSRSA
jgi:hypothetical protein